MGLIFEKCYKNVSFWSDSILKTTELQLVLDFFLFILFIQISLPGTIIVHRGWLFTAKISHQGIFNAGRWQMENE